MKTAEEAAKEYSDKFKHLSMAERIGAEVWYKDGFESRQGEIDKLQAFKDFAEDAVKAGKPFRMFDVLLTPTATNS